MTGQETRNKLTDYWASYEVVPGQEFAILTNMIHQEWTGLSIQAHKKIKRLKSQNLRDHQSEAELIFYGFGRAFHAPDCRDHCRKGYASQ